MNRNKSITSVESWKQQKDSGRTGCIVLEQKMYNRICGDSLVLGRTVWRAGRAEGQV